MNSISREVLLQRIMQPAPAGSFIVPGSTPVISFGNLYTAHTVSIGINPSVDEFMSRHKLRQTLEPGKKRLIDYETLGLKKGESLSPEQAECVLIGCFDYFKNNPYHWFNKMEKYLINPSGASYFDGTAAHLDLVQWATDPVWQNIKDKSVSTSLIETDKALLLELLKGGNYREILLNGATVVETVQSLGLFDLIKVGRIEYGKNSSSILLGEFGKTRVRATTLNIPSARGLEGPEKFRRWLHGGTFD